MQRVESRLINRLFVRFKDFSAAADNLFEGARRLAFLLLTQEAQ